MAYNMKKFYIGTPTTSNAQLYAIPSGKIGWVKNITISNTTSTAAVVTISLGGKSIVSGYSIAGNDTVVIDLNVILNAGDLIEGFQVSPTAVNVFISGTEI